MFKCFNKFFKEIEQRKISKFLYKFSSSSSMILDNEKRLPNPDMTICLPSCVNNFAVSLLNSFDKLIHFDRSNVRIKNLTEICLHKN